MGSAPSRDAADACCEGTQTAPAKRLRPWHAAVALFVVGFALGPMLRASSVRLAVAMAAAKAGSGFFNQEPDGSWKGRFEATDPWGERLFATKQASSGPEEFYSAGPDGCDDGSHGMIRLRSVVYGHADDIVVSPDEVRLARFVGEAPAAVMGIGVLVLWLSSAFVRRPRSPSLAVEAGRAAGVAVVPAIVLVGMVAWVGKLVGGLLGREMEDVLEDASGAGSLAFDFGDYLPVLFGGSAALAFFLAFAWRVRRPLETPPSDPSDRAAGAPA